MRAVVVLVMACSACSASNHPTTVAAQPIDVPPTFQTWLWEAAKRRCALDEPPEVTCPDAVLRIEGGLVRGRVCPDEAASEGLTIIDLADAWTPTMFGVGPDGKAPAYRDLYLKLAAERDANGKPLDGADALGELYGIVPSLAVLRARLANDARHACRAKIDSAPIKLLDKPYGQDHGEVVKVADQTRAWLAVELERERKWRGLPDAAALAAIPGVAQKYSWWKKLDEQRAGLLAAQQHLVCEGFLDKQAADGLMGWQAGNGAELFQRRNFLMPNERFDVETREALMLDSRELDFRLALRILRERVVDATGLIEDGTAGDGPKPILGRMLDPAEMRAARGHDKALANGATDLVSTATDAAARQLGWLGAAEVRAFFDHPELSLDRHRDTRVAIALPSVPSYHAKHMKLFAELDRGDVWYDELPLARFIHRRPMLVLYVDDEGTKRPLMRWPTTIGGWSDVRNAGGWVEQRWKESDVGPRVWRDLYAAPTWLAPPTTPDRDLVKNLWNGRWDLKRSIFGPGPHAAYGMVLLSHHQVWKQPNGKEVFWENGIGTHGSSSVTSIVHGTSHGCHRLYNQLAVRLGNFLLRHRDHVVKGQQPELYRRIVQFRGTFVADVNTRGFLYELTPPVPIEVLPGNIRTVRKIPPFNAAVASQ